ARERNHSVRSPQLKHALIAYRSRLLAVEIPVSVKRAARNAVITRPYAAMRISPARATFDYQRDSVLLVNGIHNLYHPFTVVITPPPVYKYSHACSSAIISPAAL